MITHRTGFVYVMHNPAIPGMVKIGLTTLLPEDRAAKISAHEGVPLPYEVVFRALAMRWEAVERLVHQRLAAHRVSPRREFFSGPADTAIETVRTCVSEINGVHAWDPIKIHPLGGNDRVVLALEAGDVFVLLTQPSPLVGGWQPLDLWQAHSNGDQLEVYAVDDPGQASGFSEGDAAGDVDPVPYLDRAQNVANGILNGKELLAPGDRLLWLRDNKRPGESGGGALFEAQGYCQVASRTWSPRSTPDGFPLILNALMRDPSPAMLRVARSACGLPGTEMWGPRPPARDVLDFSLPCPEQWLPQLKRQHGGRSRKPRNQA